MLLSLATLILSVFFFFLHKQFTRFQTKKLQSPDFYISGCTWDRSQKCHYKVVDKTTGCA